MSTWLRAVIVSALGFAMLVALQASSTRGLHCAKARARLHAFDAVASAESATGHAVSSPTTVEGPRELDAEMDGEATGCPPSVVALPPVRGRELLTPERRTRAPVRPPPPISRTAVLQIERPPRRA